MARFKNNYESYGFQCLKKDIGGWKEEDKGWNRGWKQEVGGNLENILETNEAKSFCAKVRK